MPPRKRKAAEPSDDEPGSPRTRDRRPSDTDDPSRVEQLETELRRMKERLEALEGAQEPRRTHRAASRAPGPEAGPPEPEPSSFRAQPPEDGPARTAVHGEPVFTTAPKFRPRARRSASGTPVAVPGAPPPGPPTLGPAAGGPPHHGVGVAGRPLPPAAPSGRPPGDAESILGGTWLAIAGVVVLVLGVVFFFALAFERGWIGLTARILIGVAGGLLIAAVGDLLGRTGRYGVYPQILAGGGAVIVYFSLYASYAFPEYRAATGMTLELSALVLGAWALGLAAYAVGRHAQALAALAVGLGALTALFGEDWAGFSVTYLVVLTLAATGAASWRQWEPVAIGAPIAAYVTLFLLLPLGVAPEAVMWGGVALGLGALDVAHARRWPAVATTAVLATGIIIATALVLEVDLALATTVGVVAAVAAGTSATLRGWPLVSAAALLVAFAVLHEAFLLDADAILLLAAGGVLLVASAAAAFATPVPSRPDHAAAAALVGNVRPSAGEAGASEALAALAGLGFLAFWTLYLLVSQREDWEASRGPVTGLLGLAAVGLAFLRTATQPARAGWAGAGVFLLLLWPPMQFDGVTVTIAWSLILLATALVAMARPVAWLQAAMLAAAVAVAVHFALLDAPDIARAELGAGLGLVAVLAATTALLLAWQAEARHAGPEDTKGRIHLALAMLLPIVYFAVALEGWFISIAWAAEALLIVVAGVMLSSRDLRLAALAVFGVVLARIFLVDMTGLALELRVVTFLATGAVILFAAFLFARQASLPLFGAKGARRPEGDAPARRTIELRRREP